MCFAASATLNERDGEIVLKVVNAADTPITARVVLAGSSRSARGRSCIMPGGALDAANSFDNPNVIRPVTSAIGRIGAQFDHEFAAPSLTVLRLPTK